MICAAIRGLRNPFRSRLCAGVVVLLALVTGFLALMVQAALASRDQIAQLDAQVRTLKTAVVVVLLGALSSSVVVNAMAGSLTTEVNGVRVELTSVPETPVTDRKTTYTVRLVDAAGKPVTDARVTLTGRMADGMSAVTPLRPAREAGVYRGQVLFTMGGPWDLTIRVVRPTGRVEIPLREEVAKQR